MNTLLAVLVPLAAKTPDPADVKAGWLGFGVFIALAIAVVLLWLSLRKQLPQGRLRGGARPEEAAAPQRRREAVAGLRS